MTHLTPEEKEILESVEQGEWQSIDNLSEKIDQYKQYAQHSLQVRESHKNTRRKPVKDIKS